MAPAKSAALRSSSASWPKTRALGSFSSLCLSSSTFGFEAAAGAAAEGATAASPDGARGSGGFSAARGGNGGGSGGAGAAGRPALPGWIGGGSRAAISGTFSASVHSLRPGCQTSAPGERAAVITRWTMWSTSTGPNRLSSWT